MSLSRLSALCSISLFLLVVAGTAAAQYTSSDEYKLFNAVNRVRQSNGLPSLKWDDALASAARRHAHEMAKYSAISHQLPDEQSLPARMTRVGVHFTALAENVDSFSSAEEIHSRFMNSHDHRANILDADMDSIGIGVVRSHHQLFAVEDFSRAK